MRNPIETRNTILKESGILFNTQGYKATSISDITDATGYTKGAIYRHFVNKDELEMETLHHLSHILFEKLRSRIIASKTAGAKLRSIFHFFASYITHPPIPGGCPLMNAAIEADDSNAALRKASQKVLKILRQSVITILSNGIKHKQIQGGIDKAGFAALIIASLEGAIMMSKLAGNNDDIKRIIKFLDTQLLAIEL